MIQKSLFAQVKELQERENKNKNKSKNKIFRRITRTQAERSICYVTQANDMFEYKTDLTLNENKIVFAIIAQILKYDKEIPWYRINTVDLCKLCKFDGHNSHRLLDEIAREICQKVFYIRDVPFQTEDGEEERENIYVHWIDGFSYDPEANEWTIHLSNLMRPFILNLKRNFTSEAFSAFAEHRTLLGFRLHGFFAKEFDLKTSRFSAKQKIDYEMFLDIPVAELRIWAQTKEKYIQYGEFKRNILLPAIEELNMLKYFSVNKIENKGGKYNRKIETITFVVKIAANNARYEKAIKEIQTIEALPAPAPKETELSLDAIHSLFINMFGYDKDEWKEIATWDLAVLIQALKNVKKQAQEQNLSRADLKRIGKRMLQNEIDAFYDYNAREIADDEVWDVL